MSAVNLEGTTPAEIIAPAAAQPAPPTVVAIPGSITKQIGSGDHAQNSIVYQTILWSFIAGAVLSVSCFIYVAAKGGDDPMRPIKEVWSIFGPIITLALGYMFGKGK